MDTAGTSIGFAPAATMLIKCLEILAAMALIQGALRIMHILRARKMRALATGWGFNYIGPPTPKWWNPSHLKVLRPLPGRLSQFHPTGRQIRQVWNVIEGRQNGVSVFIFDSVVGLKGGVPITFVACETEQNPFGPVKSPDRVIQSHGWTVLHGVCFFWFSWLMGIKRLDNHVNKLRTCSGMRA
jgi:hypothetical protein